MDDPSPQHRHRSTAPGGRVLIESLAELAEMTRRLGRDAHLRFSQGPEHDRGRTSRDYESGLDLPGLSVNPLTPEPWWTRPAEDWLARQLCNYVHLMEESRDERRPWVLVGEVVARGPDNEPIIAEYQPVADLSDEVVAEAKRRYAERFDVAEDST